MQKPIKETISQLPIGETGEYREFSSDEIIEATQFGLRNIRTISEKKLGFANPTSSQCQEYLVDAEALGLTTADYSLHPYGEDGTIEQRNAWLYAVDRISGKYGSNLLDAITNKSSRARDMSHIRLSSFLAYLRMLAKRPLDVGNIKDLEKFILGRDETGLSIQDLRSNNLIIFSPLSTDYLTACFFYRYTQLFLAPDCFRLKPLILSEHYRGTLRAIAMPDLKDGDYPKVARTKVFVEHNTTGDTMNASWKAIDRFYRSK